MTQSPTEGKCANPAGGLCGMPLALRLSEGLDLARWRLLPVIALVFGALAVVVVLVNVLFGINKIVSGPIYVEASPAVAMPLTKDINVVNMSEYPDLTLPLGWVGKVSAPDKGKPFSRNQEGLSGSRFFAFHVRELLGQRLSRFEARQTNDGISNGGWCSPVVRDLNRHLSVPSIRSYFSKLEPRQNVSHFDIGALSRDQRGSIGVRSGDRTTGFPDASVRKPNRTKETERAQGGESHCPGSENYLFFGGIRGPHLGLQIFLLTLVGTAFAGIGARGFIWALDNPNVKGRLLGGSVALFGLTCCATFYSWGALGHPLRFWCGGDY